MALCGSFGDWIAMVQLNDEGYVELPSPLVVSLRAGTAGSEDFNEKSANLRIDMDHDQKKSIKSQMFSSEFRFNAELSLRVAFGVVIASLIQTRDPLYDPSIEHDKKWFFFPDWYYLGGLSYCAVAVIFSAGKNIGATLTRVCQAFYGVGMALAYNLLLFSYVDVHQFNDSYDDYVLISKKMSFGSSDYYVNSRNFYAVLPWMVIFTVVVLLMPLETNTKKFALGNNLYFTLTIINPTDPLDSSKLKASTDTYFDTSNILNNLAMYFLVGSVGTLISLIIMFIPYPIFAIAKLREETKKASGDVLDLLNVIVDSYCFKNKNVDHMNFLKLKLQRKFDAAVARHRRMITLLEDVWWEQVFGFHVFFKFNRSVAKNYVRLIGSLIADLRSLNNAMQLEQYDQLHFMYMKVLQREIYVIQMRSGDLLNEISSEIHVSSEQLDLKTIQTLQSQMENTLRHYREAQIRLLQSSKVTIKDVEGNVPLNLFLFSLNSFCSTLIEFQDKHNEKDFHVGRRARAFVADSIQNFFMVNRYTQARILESARMAVAIVIGTFMAVYLYGFSSTTPAAVSYVMGNHIGGSFSVTLNRVGGVVAGSVVPSVFQFFISHVCNPQILNVFLTDVVLFVWVTLSMYVKFVECYSSYSGLVSAFIAAGVLLRQTDVCYTNSSDGSSAISISSYSYLAQTSVGLVLIIVLEMAMCPESALSLLRKNIQQTLKLQQKAVEILFGHHLSSSGEMSEETMEEVRDILQVQIPAQLVEQQELLIEAETEPQMWRPAFSKQKYEAVFDSTTRLLNNNNLLFKLVRWYNYRVKQNLTQTNTVDIRDSDTEGASVFNANGSKTTHTKWQEASNHFLSAVDDTFNTLQMLFGESFLYSDPDQTAIFMQMKEAFRLADQDCSGEIDADEVAAMLETIFAQSGAVKQKEITKYVADFMEVVDKDRSGKVSFEEFMEALEDGLKLEVEVYHRRKPKAATLKQALSSINEDGQAPSHPPSTSRAYCSVTSSNGTGRDKIRASMSYSNTPKKESLLLSAVSAAQSTPKTSRFLRRASTMMNSPIRRNHDVLNVEDFSTSDIAAQMKSAYVEWLMEGQRFKRVTMEELLLLNCLVSGAEGIARNLTLMEEILVSS
ncbi:putative transmembrane protein [Phytophthora cinnamomi]|uniref:putative transmembrane protein n=1 Tax=Phytophthora cinnamomi TaxID=4785 RepID=UPI003559BEED|nr:putative transmembrane protein [Phytophthora cinnamomi]